MYISRLELDMFKSRKAFASPQVFHAALESCFNDTKPESENSRKLWRIDRLQEKSYMLIVSAVRPELATLTAQFGSSGETKDYSGFLSRIETGRQYRFRFCGNPVHSVFSENTKRGKIYPHITVEQKENWFASKANPNGFEPVQSALVETGRKRFYRASAERPVIIDYSVFEGVLEVIDVDVFRETLTRGFGRAKAYGCGLMTIVGGL
ncbi:MAG: type I-E CRISPR-associated protein Cas6/Cse3/CasE [Oscillospiraceae bacterium]|nr:type I-E CRISPR-associated protein Cas6/Cse3/CasE [Oscillospiraceae bacterium]